MTIGYKLTTSDPAEILTALRNEITRRRNNEQARSVGARNQREAARHAGALQTYQEIIWLLQSIEIAPEGSSPSC